MSGVAPMQALTESAQKGKAKTVKHTPNVKRKQHSRSKPGKREQVTFDEDARKEYLTGFQKRKQQRRKVAHEQAQLKIRDELRKSRMAAVEMRKKQAAENVRAEKLALGIASDEENEEQEPLQEEHDFENEERRAHVTVQEFDLDTDWSAPLPKIPSLPPSSRRVAKKEQSVRTSLKRAEKPRINASKLSGSLTGILEPDVAEAARADKLFKDDPVLAMPTHKKRPFSYSTAAERAQERFKQGKRNHLAAEARREENRKRVKGGKKKRTERANK